MRNFIPALILFFNATTALAQSEPYEESANNISSQRLVIEALNYSAAHPAMPPAVQVQPQPAPPMASGIGPSSNMPQPGDYGYSAWSDLRQLNF